MIVLTDVEWIEKDGQFLTQLAAVRCDENWQPVSSFNAYVCPPEKFLAMNGHIAFGGVPICIYEQALTEEDAALSFFEWLEATDTIWTWAESNAKLLTKLKTVYAADAKNTMRSVAAKVRRLAGERRDAYRDAYDILGYAEVLPKPKHRAENDVEAMRLLLSYLRVSEESMAEKEKPDTAPKALTRREKNARTVERSRYNYIYLEGRDVFHRRGCKLCLGSARMILGSVYYKNSAEGRRPCAVCKPVPDLFLVPAADGGAEKKKKEPCDAQSEIGNELVCARMINGQTLEIKRKKILGRCHFAGHPGAVNKSLMEAHDCLGKKCRHFERYADSPFWAQLEQKKREEEERKARIRMEKMQKAIEQEHIRALTENWQEYLDDTNSDMYIVRVERETPTAYKIFYVSDNRFADANRYPEFLNTLRLRHPRCRIWLRHIRDVDGHFVTTSEYFSRRRK